MENKEITRTRYSISGWVVTSAGRRSMRVTDNAIVAEFTRIGRPVPDSLIKIMKNGARYSFEDFDTLGAAMSELYKVDAGTWERIGTQERF